VRANGGVHEDLAWSYRTPLPESQKIAGLIAFYNEKVDIYVTACDRSGPGPSSVEPRPRPRLGLAPSSCYARVARKAAARVPLASGFAALTARRRATTPDGYLVWQAAEQNSR
jgi:Domain of unknown function (DUF427)